MARKPAIALPALHWWMWEQRTSGDVMKINLNELAPILGITPEGLRAALVRMERDGRVVNTPHRYVYQIIDPALLVTQGVS